MNKNLLQYYSGTRGIGHTAAAMKGIAEMAKNQKVGFVVGSISSGESILRSYDLHNNPNVVIVTIGDINKIRGFDLPLVWDNYAMTELLVRSIEETREHERRVEKAIAALLGK